jgi:tetratricopeptide (TPR) repeat protein
MSTATTVGEDTGSEVADATEAASSNGASPVERLAELRESGKLKNAPDLVDEAIAAGVAGDALASFVSEVVDVLVDEAEDPRAAERAIHRAERAHPDDVTFLRMRSELLRADGRAGEAMAPLKRLGELLSEDAERAAIWEQMGDIASEVLQKPQDALVHYQAAFRAERQRRSAIRKAAELYLAQGREEQALQLVDLEAELHAHMSPKPEGHASELAKLYVRIAETLVTRPPSHAQAEKSVEGALKHNPTSARAAELKTDLEEFPKKWKEHVRRLRDAALDARDKRAAAANYLAIAQIYRTYDPTNEKHVDQNVDKCLLMVPGYRPALKFLEGKYREEGRMDAFLERLQKQAKTIRTPDVAVDIWLFIAVLLGEQGASPDDMAAAYEQVRKIDPRNLGAISALTELHLGAAKYAEAAGVMEDFLAQATDADAKRSTLRQLARIYEVELKEPEKAAEHLEQLRELGGGDDVALQLASLYDKLGNEEKLADALEGLLDTPQAEKYDGGGVPGVLQKLIELYQETLDQPEKAFMAARRLFVVTPTDALEAELQRLADALARAADLAETFEQAAAKVEDPASGRRFRLKAAEGYMLAGQVRRARAAIDGLLATDAKDPDALGLLDRILERDAGPEELVEVLESRLQGIDDPANRVRTLLTLADAYARLRKMDAVIERLSAVIEVEPKHHDALSKLDDALRSAERFEELADVLARRRRYSAEAGDQEVATRHALRLAQILDERLNRAEDAAALYLEVHAEDGERTEVLRALERLLARGVASVSIAEALQPYYAQAESWRRHVEMIEIRRDAEEDAARRAALSRGMAGVLEEKLRSSREAFDAWGAALIDEPDNAEAVQELARLAEASDAHARFAEVIERAAESLPDGPAKNALLARRADLLQGVLGDQAAAIDAHQALLAKSPGHLPSLDALADIYEKREAWAELREILVQRLEHSPEDKAATFAARLGILQLERFGNAAAARDPLERALHGESPAKGVLRTSALRAFVSTLKKVADDSGKDEDIEALAEGLKELASVLAGTERAEVRAEYGDLLRTRLGRRDDALAAYEAALANDPENATAEGGVRGLLDDVEADQKIRRAAARVLTPRYEKAENHASRAHVLAQMLTIETDDKPRRTLVRDLSRLFVEELDSIDDALTLLLEHLERDPGDANARQEAETLAFTSGQTGALFETWGKLREAEDASLSQLYGERVADLAEKMGDLERLAEAVEYLLAKAPEDAALWERLRGVYDQRNDGENVARCLAKLADLADGPARVERLIALSDFLIEVLEDDDRGLDALRSARQEAPDNDAVLARLQTRLSEVQRLEELSEVVGARADLSENTTDQAQLWLLQGDLYLRGLGRADEAVHALTRSLEVERDGNATAQVSELLQQIARRDDEVGIAALDAILDHHRAQEAWQPLVESLEIASEKRTPGEERAALLDEVSRLYEDALRVPQLAFREACRAFRDAPTAERDQRVHALADATGSFAELMAVLEDVAEVLVEDDTPRAIELYREVCQLAQQRLDDQERTVRAAEAILQLAPGDSAALATLEAIHRNEADRERLIEVLQQRAQAAEDPAERHNTLLELGRLLLDREDPDGAERAFRQVVHEAPENDAALEALDELYHRTGNSAAHVDILERRASLIVDDAEARARLRVRLAHVRLTRRGDPAGASDDLAAALEDSAALPEVRQGIEMLIQYARQHGAPPLAEAALLLEQSLRAQEDWAALPHVLEMRLIGEADRAARAALLLEVAQLQEEKLEEPDFAFMSVFKAMRELPEDESLRAEAERLAKTTDNEDALKELYDDLVDEVEDPGLRSYFLRRVAEIAEAQGDLDDARDHLLAAVRSGAQDMATMQNLARLTRQGGDPEQHSQVLQGLAEAAVLEVKADVAKEAWAELADIQENIGHLDEAVAASRELLVLEPGDAVARATMERLLQRAERWNDLADFLSESIDRINDAAEQADLTERLIRVLADYLQDAGDAVARLELLAELTPEAPSIMGLGAHLLQLLAHDGRDEAVGWRAKVATLLEPRFQAAEDYDRLVHVLRMRLEALTDVAARRELWVRITDLYEKVLDQPEQAFMAVGRALGESPGDTQLRDLAERISVRLGDVETLIGLYDDISEKLSPEDRLRIDYALRSAELYEGSVGAPAQAAEYYEVALAQLEQGEEEEAERRADLLERLDRLYRATGNPERLAAVLSRRAELLPEDAEDRKEQVRQLLFESATIQMHGMNDYGAAISTLNRLLESSPKDLPALRSLAEACMRQERWPELAEALEAELELLPDSDAERIVAVRFELGVTLDRHLNIPDAGMAQFQSILEIAPEHVPTREYLEQRRSQPQAAGGLPNAEYLQRAYEKTGDWAKAVDVLREQVTVHESRGDLKEAAGLMNRVAQIQREHMPGQEALAFGTLCSALKLDPSSHDIRGALFEIAEQNEMLEELCEFYEEEAESLEEAGKNAMAAELLELMGDLYADHVDDVPKAIATFEQILEKHPGRGNASERLSEFYGKAGRFEELEQLLRRRLMFLDEPQDRAPLLMPLASTLADHLDRPEEAVPLLMELRRHDSAHKEARRLLIELNDAAGDLDQLRPLLEEELLICRDEQDEQGIIKARGRLAVLLGDQLDDPEAAVPYWEEIWASSPEDPAVLTALERLYERLERWGELKSVYESILEKTKEPAVRAEITLKLGELLAERLGGAEEAVQRHLKVLEFDPRNEGSLDALRKLYRVLGQWDDLVALLRRMMRFQTEPTALKGLRFDLAEALGGHLERRAEAIEMGRRILDIEPHSGDELERLAGIFRQNNAYEELGGVLERRAGVVDAEAKVTTLTELADLYETQLNRGEAAAPAYEQILATDPTHDRAYERLCEIYEGTNQWQKLVALKEDRARRVEDADARLDLLREVGRIQEEKLSDKMMAFMAACRAYNERVTDRELADWMERLAVDTDAVEEAIEIYDDSLGDLEDEGLIIDTHLRMAKLAWEQLQESDDAETHYKRVLEYDADNLDALQRLVAMYEAQERWQDAVHWLERKAEHADDVATRVEQLREICRVLDERAGDSEGAIKANKRILELDGRDAGALHSLSELYERGEDWQNLISILERQEEQAEQLEDRLALRARIASIWEQQLDNADQAVAVHKSILADDETYQVSLKALERLHTNLGRSGDLIETFERMAAQTDDPEEQVRLLGKIASTWEESFEDNEKAVLANERILAIDDKNVGATKSLQRLFRNLREWESLIEMLQKHVSLSGDPQEIIGIYLDIGNICHKELGQTDRAEDAYNAALDFDPGSRDALHALGELYERSGNWFNALEKLQQEAQLAGETPEGVELQYRIGNINKDMLLDIGAAKDAYSLALDMDERHLPSIRALKGIAQNEKQDDDYLKWLKTEAAFTDDEEDKTELHTTAGLFMQDNLSDLEGAAEEFEAALAVTFDHLAAARPLADISFSNENWERAEQLLDIIVEGMDATEEATDLCRMHYRLGYVCEKLEKQQKALKNYQRAYELDSTYLPGLEGLGAALSRGERWEDAAKIYQAILIHHKDSLTDAEVVDYYQQLAQLYHHLEDTEKSTKNLQKALEIDSGHGPSLRLLADVNLGQSRHEDAYDALMRLVPLTPTDDRVRLLVEIGKLSRDELDDAYRAIDAYEDANRQKPQDSDILLALLDLYRTTKQGGRAVEVLEELVRIEPDEKERVRLNHSLGEVYRDEMKNDARAVQYFNAALDLDPTYIRAFQAAEELLSRKKNWQALADNYIKMLGRIGTTNEGIKRELWKNLAGVYRYRLKNAEGAAQAYTVLHKMEPDNVENLEALADLLARVPGKVDEAIVAYQKLVPLTSERPQRAFHALVRLYHNRRMPDRAFVTCASLKVIGDLLEDEAKLYAHYLKAQPAEPKAALTPKLWDAALVHPQARGPIADISQLLWRAAAPLLSQPVKNFGLDKKKLWKREDLDAPVPTFFVTQLKKVRNVLSLGQFNLYLRRASADPLSLLPIDQPTLMVGEANEVFREMPDRQLRFLCARQVAYFRPPFILPRVIGAQGFQAVIEAAIRLVEPRYPARSNPQLVQQYEKQLAKVGPGLVGHLRKPVSELLKSKAAVNVRPFLEGMEHTCVRAAYVLTGHLEMAAMILKQPDPGPLPLPYGVKLQALLMFAVSDANFELRQRLGMSTPT